MSVWVRASVWTGFYTSAILCAGRTPCEGVRAMAALLPAGAARRLIVVGGAVDTSIALGAAVVDEPPLINFRLF